MEVEMLVEFRGDHIYIRHGTEMEINPDSMTLLWQKIGQLCRQYSCGKILIEGTSPKRRMDTINAFESGVEAAEVYPDLWIALCLHDYEPDEISDLFVTAARNRGARVKFFSSIGPVLRWLGVSAAA